MLVSLVSRKFFAKKKSKNFCILINGQYFNYFRIINCGGVITRLCNTVVHTVECVVFSKQFFFNLSFDTLNSLFNGCSFFLLGSYCGFDSLFLLSMDYSGKMNVFSQTQSLFVVKVGEEFLNAIELLKNSNQLFLFL
jgi:hypothetical protein